MQERMQAAKTPEERQKLRDEYRSLAETRAKERGVTMRPPRDPAQGRGGRMPMAGQDLFTQEERIAQHAKIKAAATPEDQQKLRDEFRAEAQARAAARGGNTPAPQPPAAQPTPQPSPQPK